VPLIVYGIVTEQSIGKLFLASVVPGIIVAILFIVIIYMWSRIDPELGPKGVRFSGRKGLPQSKGFWVFLIILHSSVRWALKGFFFTPTEQVASGLSL
jgi:TRAP-type C4-dicarboxylate transport system permease large subunit